MASDPRLASWSRSRPTSSATSQAQRRACSRRHASPTETAGSWPSCGERVAAPGSRSIACRQRLIDATIATEDATFYYNVGVDPARIAGAALQNAQQGEVVSGASTITMQLRAQPVLGPELALQPDYGPQDAGGWPGSGADHTLQQGRAAGNVSQPAQLRPSGLWAGSCGPGLLWQVSPGSDAGRGKPAGRDPATARQSGPIRASRRRQGAPANGAGLDGASFVPDPSRCRCRVCRADHPPARVRDTCQPGSPLRPVRRERPGPAAGAGRRTPQRSADHHNARPGHANPGAVRRRPEGGRAAAQG